MLISNVSGTVDVRGWDRNEVQVTGHLGEDVERVDVETSGGRTVIKVVLPRGSSHDGDATLEIQVPRMQHDRSERGQRRRFEPRRAWARSASRP